MSQISIAREIHHYIQRSIATDLLLRLLTFSLGAPNTYIDTDITFNSGLLNLITKINNNEMNHKVVILEEALDSAGLEVCCYLQGPLLLPLSHLISPQSVPVEAGKAVDDCRNILLFIRLFVIFSVVKSISS